MISRVASVPRICQSCRQGLLLRRNPTLSPARLFHSDNVLQRRNDPHTIQSKARVEALISGKNWEEEKPSGNKRQRHIRKSRTARGDELPDWGLTSEQEQAASKQNRPSKHRNGPRGNSKSNKTAQLHTPREGNSTAWQRGSKDKGRAVSRNSPNVQQHRNSRNWNKFASKDKPALEQHENPDKKHTVVPRGTASHEDHQPSKSKETVTSADEIRGSDSKDNTVTKHATILEENRLSKSEIILSHALGTSIQSTGLAPDSTADQPHIINESEDAKTEDASGLASQTKNDFTLAEHDEESAISQDYKGHAKKQFKHRLLQKHSLGIGALGEDISALVLPNPDKLRPKSNHRILLPPDKKILGSELDWKSLIPDETEALDISVEVQRNIEELRPKDSTVIKARDFRKIIQHLVNGFTKEQLATYFRQAYNISSESTDEAPNYPWLFNETAWVSSTAEPLGHQSPKENVAYLILKKGWALDMQEEVEGLGVASVTLRPDVFKLISNPSTGALESLQSNILDGSCNEAIVTNEKKNELHIHARKTSLPAILSRIDEAAQAMQTQKISVEGVDSLNLRKDVLDRLSSITKTFIQYQQHDSKLDIMWLGQGSTAAISKPTPNTPNLQIESPADVVFRLLQDRHLHLQSDFEVISGYSRSTTTRLGMSMPYDREVRSLSWRNKIRTWSRYVLPISKSTTTTEPPKLGLSSGKNVLRVTPEFEIEGAEPQLAATFGYVLRSGAEPSQTKKEASLRRVLLPVLPHPAAFTEIAGEGESESPPLKTSSIVLNFIPATHDSKAPEVRLSLPVNADDNFSDFTMSKESKLYAISPIQQQDLMFPGESVDARLTHQRVLPLDIEEQPHIQEFFGASEFNLVEGRLRTPSHTRISLPPLWPSTNAPAAAGVAYTFAGLEIHQTIDLEWQGHNLRYNSIEAGQHGGTRQELSLHAKLGAEVPHGITEPKRAAFLQLVEGIVTGKFFSWTEGSKAIREIPDEYELDGTEDQDYDEVDGLGLPDAEDAWSQSGDESHGSSAEPVSIYEQCDKTLGSGEELSAVVREALNGREEFQSTSYLDQGEAMIQTSEELANTIEDVLARTSEQHLASSSAIAEARGVLQTTEQLTTIIEEALVEHKNSEGVNRRNTPASEDEGK